jgi:hypothetical protein
MRHRDQARDSVVAAIRRLFALVGMALGFGLGLRPWASAFGFDSTGLRLLSPGHGIRKGQLANVFKPKQWDASGIVTMGMAAPAARGDAARC